MTDKEFLEKFKIFGENVRKNREKANMTTKELSEKTGISEDYIKKIEIGSLKDMSSSKVFILANALAIPPYMLCEGI